MLFGRLDKFGLDWLVGKFFMCLGLEQSGLNQDHFMGQACYTGWLNLVDLYAL